ncbi:MAG: flagellar motor switch protein FliN [Caulobacterales bacterium]
MTTSAESHSKSTPAAAPSERAATKGDPLVSLDSAILKDVQVALQAKLGRATLSVDELLALKAGSIVKLDVKMSEPIELCLNDSLIARGEIVAVGDNFGVRIIEIAPLK